MKLKTHSFFIACLLALFLTHTPVSAARYYFSQNFSENGRINGYFDGVEDLEYPDGKITIGGQNDYYEITDFKISYSGNKFLNNLRWNCGNDCGNSLQEFEYDIASNDLHLHNSGYKNQDKGWWNINLSTSTFQGRNYLWAAFFKHDGFGSPSQVMRFAATSPLVVSQTPIEVMTPLPASIMLFGSAFFLLWLFRQKNIVW